MSIEADMKVSLLLPDSPLFEGRAAAMTAEAENGRFGLLPHHIDFVTALVPSVLTLHLTAGDEAIFGIDEGILVKKGDCVTVAVLRAVRGSDLERLQAEVQSKFIEIDEQERQARTAFSRLEADVVRRFAELRKPQI